MYRSVNTRYLSEDYLLAVNNLLKKVHRNYVLPEELAGELNIDPSETDGVISELVNNEYAYPDDDGRIELSEYGEERAEFYQRIKSSIARFLVDTLEIEPMEACRNAAMFKNILENKAVEAIMQYSDEHHLPELAEEELTFNGNIAFDDYLKETFYHYLDYIYITRISDDNPSEIVTVQSIIEQAYQNGKHHQPGLETALAVMQERGLIEIAENGIISTTGEGTIRTNEFVKKHYYLTAFFKAALNLNELDAQEAAWRGKYMITEKAFAAVEEYLHKKGIKVELYGLQGLDDTASDV